MASQSTPRRRITRVLTIGVVAIAALQLLAFVLAFSVYRDARESLDDFRVDKAPKSLRLRELSAEIRLLNVEAEEFTNHRTQDSMDALQRRIRDRAAAITRLANSSAIARESLGPKGELRALVTEALAAQQAWIDQRGRLDSARTNLLDSIAALELQTLRIAYAENTNNDDWRWLSNLVSGWDSYLLGLSDLSSAEDVRTAESGLKRELAEAALLLGGLPDDPAVTESAQLLAELLAATTAERGPFGQKLAVIAAWNRTTEASNRVRERLRTINARLNTTRGQYARDTGALLELAAVAIQRAEWIVITLAALSLIVSALLIWRVVHRGVANPLASLADRTARLAREEYGDSGEAKLGELYVEFDQIESALEVFEHNAHALKRTQNALQQSNRDLTETVADLERFSYAVSHDLRSPLRGIQTLVQFTREDLQDKHDPAIIARLDQIDQRAHQLEQILEGLLDYARAGMAQYADSAVNLGSLFAEMTPLLGLSADQVSLDLEVKHLVGPEPVLSQIFRNLIDNAIKHLAGDATLDLRISSHRDGGYTRISIEDNGPGIEAQYRDRVVRLFETLAAKSSGGGSGLGMPLIRKLLDRYGGRMELDDSSLGGLCVHIWWPEEPEDGSLPAQSTAAT